MHPTFQEIIGFVIIATVLVVIVGYANPPPTNQHWTAPGKATGGVTMHSERG